MPIADCQLPIANLNAGCGFKSEIGNRQSKML